MIVPLVLSLVPSSGLASPPVGGAIVERRLAVMGTDLHLTIEAPSRAEGLAASELAVRAIEACEDRLSTWRGDTELARLNRAPVGEPFELSPQLARELLRAREASRATGGAFDPGIGALVAAWGLRTGGRAPRPDELAAARGRGLADLSLDEGRAIRRADVRIEEGGFGKGAGLDAALDALAGSAATSGRIDLGGQWLVFGRPEAPATIGVADPRDRSRTVVSFVVPSGSVATTGNSERAIVVDGERRAHVLDPRSGRPARDWGSVTVHAPDGLWADALATGLFVLGPDAALAFADEHDGVEVLTLEPTDRGLLLRASAGWRDLRLLEETLVTE